MFRNIVKNNYGYSRKYYGPLKGAILDWSGTTVDKYVIAPAEVFRKVFEKYEVPITMKEARQPMGLRKDLHIAAITKMPEVSNRWYDQHGKHPTQLDVDNMFNDFIPMQLDCLDKYSDVIPGAQTAIRTLKNDYNLKIGATTGFTRCMVDILKKNAEDQCLYLDTAVAGDDVLNGERPNPFMIYRNMELLNISPVQSVVKVDDTVGGVGEGLSAGCWTVGVARYSNYMDIDDLEHEDRLTTSEIQYKLDISRDILRKSGAHYVIDDITELPTVVEHINDRLSKGENPS
jgi:phosphonoacetaldehyde hydrolase